ncbi:MAG: hypothetical protein K2L52_05810, partial [Clostridia bacterium]|nr:hypothetical protein [Clostridia bacterium]
MNSKTLRTRYLKSALLIITICLILGAISACLPFNVSIPELDDNSISDTAMTITQNTSDGLGEFNNGCSYIYTDKTLIDNYRADDPDTPYDLSTHQVAKTDSNRGTQDNPYVISTTDDWETFAKMMGPSTSDRGLNKYFVLADDLDFDGVEFHPIPIFKGTFYGMGHQLLNITTSSTTWTYWNGSAWTTIGTYTSAGFGVFCRTDSATITDLILQDYFITGMPNAVALTWSNYHGALVGVTCGNDSILNCHLQGEINGGTVTYANYGWCGGIVGLVHNALSSGNPTATIYRCSVNTIMVISTNAKTNFHCGGIIGDPNSGVNVHIYDCASYLNFINATRLGYIGSVAGYLRENGRVDIEDCVTVLRSAYNTQYSNGALYAFNSAKTVKNVYVDAVIGTSTAMNSASGNPTTSSNVHIGPYVNTTPISPAPTKHTTTANLLSTAQADVGVHLPSQIWDATKISEQVTPDNSPVRNYLLAFINFRNLNNGGNNEEKVGLEDGVGYIVGDSLPTNTTNTNFSSWISANKSSSHVFKGWTDDPKGESEPFTELPAGFFGNVTLYAVWGLPDSYVTSNIKTSLTSDKTLIEYDSVESITLTAKVTHTSPSSGAMTNPSVTYNFVQDGDNKTTSEDVKSSGVLSVKTVKDSGKYTFKYRLTDGLEPLWYYDGTPSNSVDIKIEKGKW